MIVVSVDENLEVRALIYCFVISEQSLIAALNHSYRPFFLLRDPVVNAGSLLLCLGKNRVAQTTWLFELLRYNTA
ncbi:hypothetical protein REC12_14175 [Desulfosporosinus sp. PR]|nr:hypothetical protein [Desulfosporosinus sp. PR]